METDEALFDRLSGGDMRAFDRLYERYERPLFGFICVQIRDTHEAEDVLHEAFMAVLRERDTRQLRSFRAWIFEVTRHLCLNRVRSRKRAGRALDTVARDEYPVGVPPRPVDAREALEQRERAVRLEGAVGRLPSTLAEVFRLRATGMSYEDVAGVLGVPEGTVKSRMNEMVKRLREEMAG